MKKCMNTNDCSFHNQLPKLNLLAGNDQEDREPYTFDMAKRLYAAD